MLLVIGKRHHLNNHQNSGGAIVLFEEMINEMEKREIEFFCIDLNYRNYKSKLNAFSNFIKLLCIQGKKSEHILFNGSSLSIIQYVPIIYLYSTVFRKQYSLRFFGGGFDGFYRSKPLLVQKLILKFLMKSSTVFFETKRLVKEMSIHLNNVLQLPNSRLNPSVASSETYSDQFIFIGQIREEKGIKFLLEAYKLARKKEQNLQLSLYGPIVDLKLTQEEQDIFDEVYKGALKNDQVVQVLSQANVFIFPSIHKNEGHPGSIIEALSVGLPIVSTNVGSVKELLNDDCSIMVEMKSINSLKGAMLSFNQRKYEKMRLAALVKFREFDKDFVCSDFFNHFLNNE